MPLTRLTKTGDFGSAGRRAPIPACSPDPRLCRSAGPEPARAESRSPPGERMVIRVFISSSSGFVAIKKQQDVVRLLETTRERFEEVDIPMSEKQRRRIYNNIPWRRHLLRQPSATSDV